MKPNAMRMTAGESSADALVIIIDIHRQRRTDDAVSLEELIARCADLFRRRAKFAQRMAYICAARHTVRAPAPSALDIALERIVTAMVATVCDKPVCLLCARPAATPSTVVVETPATF